MAGSTILSCEKYKELFAPDFAEQNGDFMENKTGNGSTEKIQSVMQSALSPGKPTGKTSDTAPGSNGRGAVRVCSKCGNRYADTGVGCPVCNGLKKQ